MTELSTPLTANALNRIFLEARSVNHFSDRPVTPEHLRALYDLMKWGPTAMNAQPARLVFVTTQEAKQRLAPALAPTNVDKTMRAPVTVIVAQDSAFHDQLPTQFPAYDARPMFEANAALRESTAMRNSSMQAGYLIIAARALGLDAGPMSGFDNKKLDEAFFADGAWQSNVLINLGFGDATGNHPRGPRLSFDEACKIL